MRRTPAESLLLALALLALPAAADEAPPREFWLYFAAYANARGELLDPAEYAAVGAAQRHLADGSDPAADTATTPAPAPASPEKEVETP